MNKNKINKVKKIISRPTYFLKNLYFSNSGMYKICYDETKHAKYLL